MTSVGHGQPFLYEVGLSCHESALHVHLGLHVSLTPRHFYPFHFYQLLILSSFPSCTAFVKHQTRAESTDRDTLLALVSTFETA